MTKYLNGSTDDTIYAAERVCGCLLRITDEVLRPDQDELNKLVDAAWDVLTWVREVLTGIDEEGCTLSPADLSRALAIIDEQRQGVAGGIDRVTTRRKKRTVSFAGAMKRSRLDGKVHDHRDRLYLEYKPMRRVSTRSDGK